MKRKKLFYHQDFTKSRKSKERREKGKKVRGSGLHLAERFLFAMFLTFLALFFLITPMALNSDSTVKEPKPSRRGPAYVAQQELKKESSSKNLVNERSFPRNRGEASLRHQSHLKLPEKDILGDKLNRLREEFSLPHDLKQRVHFWFNIYAKYNAEQHVIHHRKYPWIVYDVVDTRPIFRQMKPYAQNRREAKYLIWSRKRKVIQTLKNLRFVRANEKVSEKMTHLRQLLSQLPGNTKKIIKEASQSVRVQSGQRRNFFHGLIRSSAYMAHMEKIFVSKGLPRELVRYSHGGK